MPIDPQSTRLETAGRPSTRTLKIAGVVALCIAGLVVVAGVATRAADTGQLKSWTRAEAIPTVEFVRPSPTAAGEKLTLPGNLTAFNTAQIYARVPGYVHGWYQDIGARVKKGQLLALIDTPELDQQIAQARADVVSAQASQSLSKTTANRWAGLLAADAVSKQEADEKAGDLTVKNAAVKAAQANLDRLIALKGFARIVAPFDGVVTSRNADIGALVNAGAGSGSGSSSPLFTVADISSLRAYVHVPQSYSAQIKPGELAQMALPDYPGRTFPAKLVSTADAISDQSGTLLVELQADNPTGALKPGDYAQVSFDLPKGQGAQLTLPASALLFRSHGLEVAVVTPNNHIVMKHIAIGQDMGATVEVASGLDPADRVVDNPPDSLAAGDLVRIAGAQTHGEPVARS
jgi:multidrug efflux system membrane fusion protein